MKKLLLSFLILFSGVAFAGETSPEPAEDAEVRPMSPFLPDHCWEMPHNKLCDWMQE